MTQTKSQIESILKEYVVNNEQELAKAKLLSLVRMHVRNKHGVDNLDALDDTLFRQACDHVYNTAFVALSDQNNNE